MATVEEAEQALRDAATRLEQARAERATLASLEPSTADTLSHILAEIDAAESAERRNPHDVERIVAAHARAIRALIAIERDRVSGTEGVANA